MHLAIDGYGGDRQKMQNLELIYEVLDSYPAEIGMTKIMPPYVFRYNGSKPKDWGISGFVLIAESHISIHTFPDKAYVNVDIFSCKAFDCDLAIQQMKDKLELYRVKAHLLERGLEYPRDVEKTTEIVKSERFQIVGVAGERIWSG